MDRVLSHKGDSEQPIPRSRWFSSDKKEEIDDDEDDDSCAKYAIVFREWFPCPKLISDHEGVHWIGGGCTLMHHDSEEGDYIEVTHKEDKESKLIFCAYECLSKYGASVRQTYAKNKDRINA